MKRLILNAGQLLTMTGPDRPRCGKEMSSVGMIRDGAVLVEDGVILAAGLKDFVPRVPPIAPCRRWQRPG